MEQYQLYTTQSLRLGMKAPEFIAQTTYGSIKLSELAGRWIVFFSYPNDFECICSTEIIEFAKAAPCFAQRNTQLLGLSIDSIRSHFAWVYSIYRNTGITVPFPIVADRDGSIARRYGMISAEINETEALRTVLIIDDKQIVRALLSYPPTNGRNISEILRLLDALHMTDKKSAATPANWYPGQPVI